MNPLPCHEGEDWKKFKSHPQAQCTTWEFPLSVQTFGVNCIPTGSVSCSGIQLGLSDSSPTAPQTTHGRASHESFWQATQIAMAGSLHTLTAAAWRALSFRSNDVLLLQGKWARIKSTLTHLESQFVPYMSVSFLIYRVMSHHESFPGPMF